MREKDAASRGVRKVDAVAWRVFTEQIGVWWPLATHKIGRAEAVSAVIEFRIGGRCYERDDMRGIFDSERGWTSLLAAFAAHTTPAPKP